MSRWTVRTGTVAGTDHGSCSVAWIGRARGAAVAWPRNGPKGPFPPPERASESTVLDRQRRPNGRGALALVGGAFAGIFVATVESTIREGRGGMPAFGERLAGEEIADVVAYLEALPAATDTPGERTGPGQMTERMTEHVMWVGMAGGGWVAMLLWIVFSIALLGWCWSWSRSSGWSAASGRGEAGPRSAPPAPQARDRRRRSSITATRVGRSAGSSTCGSAGTSRVQGMGNDRSSWRPLGGMASADPCLANNLWPGRGTSPRASSGLPAQALKAVRPGDDRTVAGLQPEGRERRGRCPFKRRGHPVRR